MPAIDRDEARFAQASRQMLTAPNWEAWVVPRIQDRPRLNKPPLIYWTQAGSASLFTGRAFGTPRDVAAERDAIWMYRLPSLLAAIAAVLFTWRLGCSMFDSRAAFLGAMLLASSPIMIWESRQARSDMLLVACTTGAMWMLWEGFKCARAKQPMPTHQWVGLWLFLGMGAMTKGPITAVVVLLSTLGVSFLTRSWRWTSTLRPFVGAIIVEACVIPWILLVIDIVTWDNYWTIIHDEIFKRMKDAAEGHGGPPGYHLTLMVVLLGAGSMLVWPALLRGARVGLSIKSTGNWFARAWNARLRRAPEAFLLCWIVLPWIIFELSSTKLPHYTMPMYPAIALLAGRMVLAADSGRHAFRFPRLIRVLGGAWAGLMSLGVFALGMFAAFAALRAWGQIPSMVVGAVFAMAAVVLAWKAFSFHARGQWLYLQRTGIAMSVAFSLAIGLAGSIMPDIRVSRNLADRLKTIDPSHTRPIVAVEYEESAPGARDHGGFVEDSLIYETRGRVERHSGKTLEAWIESYPTGLVCIEDRALRRYAGVKQLPKRSILDRTPSTEPAFPASDTVGRLRILDRVDGFNYSKGKLVKVYIAEVIAPQVNP